MTVFKSHISKLKHGKPWYNVPYFCYKCNFILYGKIVRRKGSTYPGARWYHRKCASEVNLI